MHRLFLIFAATTGYAKALAILLSLIVISSGLFFYLWASYDSAEVHLRNRVIAQQQIVNITRQTALDNKSVLLAEQQKLIDYKSEYDNLREVWLGIFFLGNRPPVGVNLEAKNDLHTKNP